MLISCVWPHASRIWKDVLQLPENPIFFPRSFGNSKSEESESKDCGCGCFFSQMVSQPPVHQFLGGLLFSREP